MKESETTELKKSLAELQAGLVSIAAILNKHGHGELWFGIKDNGFPVGMAASEKTLRDVSQAIAAHIEPRIYPRITLETLDEVCCIKVAFDGHEAPYYAYGRAYMRVADEDRKISPPELERLILAKNHELHAWDSAVSEKKITDLDVGKLRRFVERAKLTWDTPANALEKLGLIKNGLLLNAASLFFDRNAPMQLRCAVFGTPDSAMIIDRHDFDGDILELIEEAQKYILKNIHIGMRLEGLYRVDVPEIPVEALREAIINAFCHRDYRDPDYVQIAIFKDRVEIRNPGRLYGVMTIDDLRKGFISQRRNPLIANLFRRIEMVEAWGRGMPLILKHVPDASFREVGGLFVVSFNRPSFNEESETPKQAPKSSVKKFGKESSVKLSVNEGGATTQETLEKSSPKGSPISSPKTADIMLKKRQETSTSVKPRTKPITKPRVKKLEATTQETTQEKQLRTTQEIDPSKGVSVEMTVETPTHSTECVVKPRTKPRTKPRVKSVLKTRTKTRTKTKGMLIVLLRQNSSITRKELAEALGLTVKGVDWQINELKKNGVVKRIGSNRAGFWEVLKS